MALLEEYLTRFCGKLRPATLRSMKIISRKKFLGATLLFVGLLPATFGLITSGISSYCISVHPDCNDSNSGEPPALIEEDVQNLKINLGIGLIGIVFIFLGRKIFKRKED